MTAGGPGPAGGGAGHNLRWLLENLLAQTPGARHVLVLSRDGLKVSWTSGLDTDQADQLAAIASGIQSLAMSASAQFGDGVGAGQAMVEFRGGLLLMIPAGPGAHLAVLASNAADVGLVGHQMNQLVAQLGGVLTVPPRQSGHSIDHAS